MALTLKPLHPLFADEVVGLDLSAGLTASKFDMLRASFEESGVVVLRDQRITPAELVAFSRRFGELETHVLGQFLLPGHPEILVISNVTEGDRPIGLADAGRFWHSNLSYKAEPSLGCALHAREVPSSGGEMLFVSMQAVLEALSPDLVHRLRGLEAEHDYTYWIRRLGRPPLTPAQRRAVPPVVHPVVIRHPVTGRETLFVNEGFTTRIMGLAKDESRALLDVLFAIVGEERFIYRHRWRPHDLVLWDNRAVAHRSAPTQAERRRTFHRTTIRGAAPVSARIEGWVEA